MTAQEKALEKIVTEIENSVKKFDSKIPATERALFDRVMEIAKKLKTSGGKIARVSENVRLIGELQREIEKVVLSDSYLKSVKEFLTSYDLVSQLQNAYFSTMVNKFKAPKLLSEIKKQSIKETAVKLTEAGISANVTQGIQQVLSRNITEGGSFASLMDQMRSFIVTSPDNIGSLARYTQQITTDSLNQYSATYNETISQDLGFEWRMYTGSLLETSRPWCVHMVKKKYVHKSELDTVINNNIDGVKICSKEIPCSKKTGLPSGMMEGTNASNIGQRRGGWQCGHQFGGVPSAVVPKDLRDKLKSVEVVAKVEQATKEPIESEIKKPVKIYTTSDNKTIQNVQKISSGSNGFNEIAEEYGTEFIIAPPKAFNSRGKERDKFIKDVGLPYNTDWKYIKSTQKAGGFATTNNKQVVIKAEKGDNFDPVNLNKEYDDFIKINTTNNDKYKLLKDTRGDDWIVDLKTGKGVAILRDGKPKPWTISSLTKSKATTVTHEQGHVVQNKYDKAAWGGTGRDKMRSIAGFMGVKLKDAPTVYGETNWSEFWAESFTSYIYARASFAIHHPKAFSLFERTAKEYGIDLNTIKEIK